MLWYCSDVEKHSLFLGQASLFNRRLGEKVCWMLVGLGLSEPCENRSNMWICLICRSTPAGLGQISILCLLNKRTPVDKASLLLEAKLGSIVVSCLRGEA